MAQKLLVCGATGFIGRNMVEYLCGNPAYEVIGVYNERPPFEWPGLSWRRANLTDPSQVKNVLQGVDFIIQAAATTSGSKDIVSQPYIHVTDNAVMNSYIFREAFAQKVKHVLFFSCTVMLRSSDSGLTEDDFDCNSDVAHQYFGVGWTKIYIEKMCEFYSSIGTTKFSAIRHSNIYGPHDKFDLERSHVFGATITKVMTSKDGKVVVWGNGEEARDLLYVGDLVDFVDRVINRQSGQYGLYNCGYGEAIQIKDLVKMIVERSGRNLKIEYDLSQPSIKTSLHLDCSKAQLELGWRRLISIEEGIDKTLEWWKINHRPSTA